MEEKSIDVPNWKNLREYTRFLAGGDEKRVKISFINEDNEEIPLDTDEDFRQHRQSAEDRHERIFRMKIYRDGKFLFHGIHPIEKNRSTFPVDQLEILRKNILGEQWHIAVEHDKPLALCLNAAIRCAQRGQIESNGDCRTFIETILPVAFDKLYTSSLVKIWPQKIHCGIFEMSEYLVDLVAVRIRSAPVPIVLLNVLSLIFDSRTVFSQSHQRDSVPKQRSYQLEEKEFLQGTNFGWLRSLLQRFLAQDGLKYLRLQFEYVDSANSSRAAMEFNSLFNVFSQCHVCINPERFRLHFTRALRQTIERMDKASSSSQYDTLSKTLIDLCVKYQFRAELDQILSFGFHPSLSDGPTSLVEESNGEEIKRTMLNHRTRDEFEEHLIKMNSLAVDDETERRTVKKLRVEQSLTPFFTREQLLNSIRDLKISIEDKTPTNTTERSMVQSYAPMKTRVAQLYDELHQARSHGKLREVIKIEEKLQLLRPFSAQFVADANLPDGTIIGPGEVFRKCWILLNDGSLPWDNETINLVNLINGIRVQQKPIIPITAPHSRTHIHIDFISPEQDGSYESKWILSYRDQTFGPIIWCNIRVQQRHLNEIPLPQCFDLNKPFLTSSEKDVTEPLRSAEEIEETRPSLMNSDFSSRSTLTRTSLDPMTQLIQLGFGNRAKNQRLLRDNNNDLARVIGLLTLDVNEDPEWH